MGKPFVRSSRSLNTVYNADTCQNYATKLHLCDKIPCDAHYVRRNLPLASRCVPKGAEEAGAENGPNLLLKLIIAPIGHPSCETFPNAKGKVFPETTRIVHSSSEARPICSRRMGESIRNLCSRFGRPDSTSTIWGAELPHDAGAWGYDFIMHR